MDEAQLWARSGLRITGYGHHLPGAPITNPTPPVLDATSVDAAVMGAVDVLSRHRAEDGQTPDVLGAVAAERALQDAGIDASEVDLVVLSNWTDRQFVPEWGPRLASALGARRAFAFDVCGACTGFVHGTQTAAALLTATPHWRTAVVVCAERFSRRVRPTSHGEQIVGDAAAAVVLRADGADQRLGLLDSIMVSDGEQHEATTVLPPAGWIKSRKDLLGTAVASHVDTVRRLLDRAGLGIEDLDWVVPHPGTGALHRAVQEAIGVDERRFVTNFARIGNTGSASIPVVLSEMRADGRLRDGDLVLTPSVGSGWFYGGLLLHV
ncbi:3-oxoacyl-[acyl-carrier-protein] synthase-3 [Nocardioides zeae]|uniref:3-oxoacyl-[acyl-carrier-protein] synthase-3 n=2 Tax=Nocardioides zeae TaxID=1457234 RepID=A0ACC6IHX8_9ACTN|nr:ketoacyl-ACP synthase III [Nocardioides zeae]MDQ1104107.1 3-oxoacyl-[acyl-carrier-protein] synthase-3 [Nocardioides zeae]MDR6176202.1 3-oxoacyl-[acyl-carrier-protein] synthase-3 [Nocardioides zeae]MDR6210348.1 3-oxoacyl-[acyl-carrier-protein] synthase-3 [Nocardioides zeae]